MGKKTLEERIRLVRKLRDVQKQDEDLGKSGYQEGYYNGLELASSILEDREPEFFRGIQKDLKKASK